MGMEDDTRLFLVTIMQTVSLLILWLLINIFVGLYLKFGLFENSPSVKNFIYYIVFITGCFFLYKHIKKKWDKVEGQL
jgi:hypothetical protein